ncbi:unnamed protein product, partial [Iphiclides podalirius]
MIERLWIRIVATLTLKSRLPIERRRWPTALAPKATVTTGLVGGGALVTSREKLPWRGPPLPGLRPRHGPDMRPKDETDAKLQSGTFILSEKIDDTKAKKSEKEMKKEMKRLEKEKQEREKREKKAREKEKEREKQAKKG